MVVTDTMRSHLQRSTWVVLTTQKEPTVISKRRYLHNPGRQTGFVNIVLWPKVFAHYATLAKTATFLGVTGTLQAEQGVVHLVAERLWRPHLHADLATVPSRDFQ